MDEKPVQGPPMTRGAQEKAQRGTANMTDASKTPLVCVALEHLCLGVGIGRLW
jgi:hypothetical protein